MSRSNPHESLQNVASRFYEWNSDDKCFKYFDKTLGTPDKEGKVKGETVNVKLPFSFLVLDVLATVKGYNEPSNKSYWSNEVRDLKKDIITVKSKSGVEASGTYEHIKEKLANSGAKYVQSVYVAMKSKDGLEIANIQMKGAALNAFIDFCKTVKIHEIGVTVKKSIEKKKGRNIYHEPVFEAMTISEKANEQAIELDKQLQTYLSAYLAKNASESVQPATQPSKPSNEPVQSNKSSHIDSVKDIDINIDNDDDELPF